MLALGHEAQVARTRKGKLMAKNVTKLALALFAMTVISATGAASAQAILFHKTNMGHTTITGVQVTQMVLSFPEGDLKCSSVHFGSTTDETTPATTTIIPTTEGCQWASLGANTAIETMNGCDLVLHANGEMDIECEPERGRSSYTCRSQR